MTADREAMTLEQVRDVLARRYGGSEACLDVNTCELMGAMINGIDSHIYQLKNIMDNVKQRTAQLDSSIARFSHAAEPVAWMYPSDLKRFETSEATADAYSIQVCRPGEDTVALYAHPSEDVRDAKRYRWLSEHEDADLYMENPGKDALDAAIDAAIRQREQGASNPLKGWIFDKVSMGRGDERYICTPDGANATTVRNESTSDHRERLLWLIADAMAKESGNG